MFFLVRGSIFSHAHINVADACEVMLNTNIELPPKHFHKNMKNELVKKLIAEVEGTYYGDYGFIVCVTEVSD